MNACLQALRKSFDEAGIEYEVVEHAVAFAAQRIAATEHIPGHQFAKSVVVMADEKPALVVLPAPLYIDFEALKGSLGAKDVRLARESEFSALFPECEVGAMPPFPGENRVPIYLDVSMLTSPRIVFEAGSHTETVGMKTDDYMRLASPQVIEFAREPEPAPAEPQEPIEAMEAARQQAGGWVFAAMAAAVGVGASIAIGRLLLRRLLPGPSIRGLAAGLAIGGAAVALVDPRAGKRRRAMVRDKASKYARVGMRKARGTAVRLSGKARGAEHKISILAAGKRE